MGQVSNGLGLKGRKFSARLATHVKLWKPTAWVRDSEWFINTSPIVLGLCIFVTVMLIIVIASVSWALLLSEALVVRLEIYQSCVTPLPAARASHNSGASLIWQSSNNHNALKTRAIGILASSCINLLEKKWCMEWFLLNHLKKYILTVVCVKHDMYHIRFKTSDNASKSVPSDD